MSRLHYGFLEKRAAHLRQLRAALNAITGEDTMQLGKYLTPQASADLHDAAENSGGSCPDNCRVCAHYSKAKEEQAVSTSMPSFYIDLWLKGGCAWCGRPVRTAGTRYVDQDCLQSVMEAKMFDALEKACDEAKAYRFKSLYSPPAAEVAWKEQAERNKRKCNCRARYSLLDLAMELKRQGNDGGHLNDCPMYERPKPTAADTEEMVKFLSSRTSPKTIKLPAAEMKAALASAHRFLASLSTCDQPVKVQREHLAVLREVMGVLAKLDGHDKDEK